MIGHTAGKAMDDRPIIEVTALRVGPSELALEGTASVYEGTVIITTMSDREPVGVHHAQASAGGPDRGDWNATVPINLNVTHVEIGEEEMEEGSETAHLRRILIDLTGLPPLEGSP